MMKMGFIFFVAIALSWTAYIRTDGFTPSQMYAPLVGGETFRADGLVKEILSEPFHYLGKGRQCFVFANENYVLKFFNKSYFQMPWYAFFTYEKEKTKREKRRIFFENSYPIAQKEFGEEIVYLHMGSSHDLPILQIFGPAHRAFQVDLNQVPFVLQKRGKPFYEGLKAVFDREGLKGLCREIDVFLAKVKYRIQKQIADGDSDVEHNWGYVNGQIFHLDPGRLFYDPSLKDPFRQRIEWQIATHRLIRWLEKHYPDAGKYLQNQLPAS